MKRPAQSLPPAYFESLYAGDADPWRFADSAYEAAKYHATLAALRRPHYARALEIGCSIGVLTQRLAARCGQLLAVDVVAAALAQAAERCRDLPQVSLRRLCVPGEWPQGERFDLILLSEVVYYLSAEDVGRLAARIGDSLAPGAELLLVHWTGETDYPLSGDEATALFLRQAGYARVVSQQRAREYRLDLLQA